MKYALTDTANLYFRMRHMAAKRTEPWEKVGTALHLTFSSINKIVKKFGPDIHVVICQEGHSWRHEFYPPYKKNRVVAEQDLTEAEIEESKLFWETYLALMEFFTAKSNVSVIRDPSAEADDIIARFIHLHPDDHHTIISSDTDFLQLIAPNVNQYNGITDELITLDGYFDHRNNLIVDKKTKQAKTLADPQFILFEKCMRGDSTDNVFSAYPGVRTKGSLKKAGLNEAYADRDKKGFVWNNMMLQRWLDHNEVEHRVKDDYERNRVLIDLTAQPQHIKDSVDETIRKAVRVNPVSNVGLHFLRFCGKYELIKLSEQPDQYTKWLNFPYTGRLNNDVS